MIRPFPPQEVLDSFDTVFEPSSDLKEWAFGTFINEGSVLENEHHAHLQQADIGFLWTNEPNEKKGRTLLGQCQLLPPTGDKWSAGRNLMQLGEWFGDIPDFLITIFAPVAADMDDSSFMALVEHELYHACQATDKYGMPQFSQETGLPVWAVKGHDVEEFMGVVDRYGSTSPELAAMVQMVNRGPSIGQTKITQACGTCLRVVK